MEELKDKGFIKAITDPEEIIKFTSQNEPILVMNVEGDGQVNFESGCKSEEGAKKLVNQMQNDPILREMVELAGGSR